ncbi:ABC transporter ATP-binding protein [Desulfosporosinus sp. OT]|uniref:ABC transporter ATP-binding protein n=1 Tax=Desulfosporosinus sp. OT TaxID=913865 RepID=UPI000223A44B|nr:ABC transporter ATP-binding protein [Desulfosporosinus sp. OT]EGW39195.1 ABC transporter, ATP-binding protein [Desulfosporosinus sp. OT]
MLSVKNLEYKYRGAKVNTLKGIDFRIHPGEIFGFLGPSGSGKTTIQRVLIGLLKGYNGSITAFDKERRDFGRDFYEKIGVAFDFPNLYLKLTAKENLQLIAEYYQNPPKDFDALLDQVGLLPDKDKKVEGFSKGMKMRLNFIRSIMHNPALMFFDEPTSGLDPVNAKLIKDMILTMKGEGKTVFLTTHNMTIAEQLCDRVAFLVDGQISLCDTPYALKLKYGRKTVKVDFLSCGTPDTSEFELDQLSGNQQFLDIISYSEIKSIHSQDASLEDIFIKVTGRELI